jgi:hypothetical protein
MSLEIDLDLGRGVTEITSPSHSIRVQQDDESFTRKITFGGGLAEMDRDAVIDVRLAKAPKPGVVVTKGSPANGTANDHFMAVTFMPEFADRDLTDAPQPSETVFVIDCSGSMQGESTRQAQAALELCLRSLAPGDTFNICRFGSSFELMRPEAVPYSGQTLRDALQYIARNADLGGTELLPPLQAIFANSPEVGVARNIVLLTDGQVSNEPEVIATARANRLRNRIFSFGIGAAASANLVNGLARATGGAAEFITANERIDDKVLRTFGRIASPMVSDVEIDWGGADVQTLAEIPPIFDGDAVAVYARTLGSPPREVTLRCKLSRGGEAKWTLPVGYAIPDDAGIVSTMWARRAFQSFEEVNGVRRTSARLREQNRDRDRLIALSKQFNLVCSLTSFIAVEHRSLEERNDGAPAVRRVPVMLAAGWGDIPRAAKLADASAMRCMYSVSPSASRSRSICKSASPEAPAEADDVALGAEVLGELDFDLERSIDKTLDRTIDVSFTWSEPTETPLVSLLESILREAVRSGATHVELRPMEDRLQVVFTIKGATHERDNVPLRMADPLAAMLKRLAGERGAVTADVDGERAELPLKFVASRHGELIWIELPATDRGVLASIVRKLHTPTVRLIEPAVDPLRRILASQTAEGAFLHWPDDLRVTRHAEVREASEILTGGTGAVTTEVLQTMSCLLSLWVAHADKRDQWVRAGTKACRYVASQLKVDFHDVLRTLEGLHKKLTAPATPAT